MKKRILAITFALVLLIFTAMPVFAADADGNRIVDSVEEKHTPTVVPDGDGNYGQSFNTEDSVIYNLKQQDLSLIALKDSSAATGSLQTELPAAYREIADAESLSDISEDLDAIASSLKPGATADNLIVSDVFGLDFSDAVKAGKPVYVSVQMRIPGYSYGAQPPVIMYKPLGSEEWVVIDTEDIVMNPDGTVQVSFPAEGGVVSFLKINEDAPVTSPEEKCCNCPDWCFTCGFLCPGDICLCWIVLVILIALLAIGGYLTYQAIAKMLAAKAAATLAAAVVDAAAVVSEAVPADAVPNGDTEVIGVHFPGNSRVYKYSPDGQQFQVGDIVRVPTKDPATGIETIMSAKVVAANYRINGKDLIFPLKKIAGR